MFGERTRSDDAPAPSEQSESTRGVRLLPALAVALLVALTLALLRGRRREEPTLEPPF